MPGETDCSSFCITSNSNNNDNNQMPPTIPSSNSSTTSPAAVVDLYKIFEPITAVSSTSDWNNSLTTYGYIGAMLNRKGVAENTVENIREEQTLSDNALATKSKMEIEHLWTSNHNNATEGQNGKVELVGNDPDPQQQTPGNKLLVKNEGIIKKRQDEEYFEIQPRRNAFIEPGSGMRDVPVWLKSLRLHKYTPLFQQMTYAEMLGLTDEKLERHGVTKGARNKIVICVQKLAERTKMLKQFEKELSDPERMGPILQELKFMLQTPIRSYPAPGHQELYQSLIDGIDVQPDQVNNENIPAHFTRVLGQVYTEFLIQFPSNCEGLLGIINHIFDRCLSHEAFTQAQKRRIINWKQIVRRAFPTASRRFSSNTTENPYQHYYNHNNKQRLSAPACSAASRRERNPERKSFGGSQSSQYPLQFDNNNPRRGQEPVGAFNGSSSAISTSSLRLTDQIQSGPRDSHTNYHPQSQYSCQQQQQQQQRTMMLDESSHLQHQTLNKDNIASAQQHQHQQHQQQQHQLQTAAMLALINGTIQLQQQQQQQQQNQSPNTGGFKVQDLVANLVAASSSAYGLPVVPPNADSQHPQHQHHQQTSAPSSPTIPPPHQQQPQFPPTPSRQQQQPNPPQHQPIFDYPSTTTATNQSAFSDLQRIGGCPLQQQQSVVVVGVGSSGGSSSPRRIAGTGQRWFGPTSSNLTSARTPTNHPLTSKPDPWAGNPTTTIMKQRNTSGESSNGSSSGSSLNGLVGIGGKHGQPTQTHHQQQQKVFDSETSSVSSLSSSCSPPIITNNNNNNHHQFLRSSTTSTENGSSPTQQQRSHYFPNNNNNNNNQTVANCDANTTNVVTQQNDINKGGLKSVPHSFTDLQAYNFELEALEPPESLLKTTHAAVRGVLTESSTLDFNARMEYLSQRVAEAAIGNPI